MPRLLTEPPVPAMPMPGKIILLDGASRAGKSTLAAALQHRLPLPFRHHSIDHLRVASVLPWARIASGEIAWSLLRGPFFEGFHRSVAAFADAGNNLLLEHIVETEEWMLRQVRLLAGFDVFCVGIHCLLEELERRERQRGDRQHGEARADFAVVHTFGSYDFELPSTEDADAMAARVVAAWQARASPGAFTKMLRGGKSDS